MKRILLPVSPEASEAERGPARYAMELACAFDAEIRAPVFELDAVPPAGIGRMFLREEEAIVAEQNRAVHDKAAAIDRVAGEQGVKLTIEIRHATSPQVTGWLCDLARLHDLVVTGVNPNGRVSERQRAERLLFRSGRPLLIVPQDDRCGFVCERIVIAWDYGAPAARAIGDAMPFLRRADDVLLIMVGNDDTFGSNLRPDDVVQSLKARGVSARYHNRRAEAASIGHVLQDFALDEHADLMVMGAFGHSRLAEFVLGGATRYVLDNLRLPVLLSH